MSNLNPTNWKLVQLQKLTEPERPITYGVVKPGDRDDENGVLFVRGGDISNGRIAVTELRTITQSVSRPYKRTILRGGELLISLNLVAFRRRRHRANEHVARGNVHEFIFVFDKKMVMCRIVGVEIGLRGINRDMTQETHFGELVQ